VLSIHAIGILSIPFLYYCTCDDNNSERYNADQVPIPFAVDVGYTYDFIGTGKNIVMKIVWPEGYQNQNQISCKLLLFKTWNLNNSHDKCSQFSWIQMMSWSRSKSRVVMKLLMNLRIALYCIGFFFTLMEVKVGSWVK